MSVFPRTVHLASNWLAVIAMLTWSLGLGNGSCRWICAAAGERRCEIPATHGDGDAIDAPQAEHCCCSATDAPTLPDNPPDSCGEEAPPSADECAVFGPVKPRGECSCTAISWAGAELRRGVPDRTVETGVAVELHEPWRVTLRQFDVSSVPRTPWCIVRSRAAPRSALCVWLI